VIEEILPGSVAVAASRSDLLDSPLFPEEEATVARAVEKRRREFTTARACARAALSQLGFPPQPILTGDRGAPQWPVGIVGSITHCDGYRACAVARIGDLASVGIDAERNEPLPDGLLGDIALPRERDLLQRLMRLSPEVCWDRLLFCMKEAVYKTWFPLAQRWLGFEDAAIEIDPGSNSFSARLLVPGPVLGDGELCGFSGRWLVRDELVLAAIALPTVPSA
jgi:4'-phosphopantetheinyl transferase EntD